MTKTKKLVNVEMLKLETGLFIEEKEVKLGDILSDVGASDLLVLLDEQNNIVFECIERNGQDGDGFLVQEVIKRLGIWHDWYDILPFKDKLIISGSILRRNVGMKTKNRKDYLLHLFFEVFLYV
jgi:hypothetical protein